MDTLLSVKKNLSAQELAMLGTEVERHKKSKAALWLLWVFAGTVGGHRYYLGDIGRAVLHTIVFIVAFVLGLSLTASAETDVEAVYAFLAMFLFLSIAAIWAIIDAFFINRRLTYKNTEIETKIIDQIKQMRS